HQPGAVYGGAVRAEFFRIYRLFRHAQPAAARTYGNGQAGYVAVTDIAQNEILYGAGTQIQLGSAGAHNGGNSGITIRQLQSFGNGQIGIDDAVAQIIVAGTGAAVLAGNTAV